MVTRPPFHDLYRRMYLQASITFKYSNFYGGLAAHRRFS